MTKIKLALTKDIRGIIVDMMLKLGISQERIAAFTVTDKKKMAEPMRLMIDSIKKSYPLLHIEELTRAFDLAMQERFEVKTSLYNKDFNFEYLSKIINAYRKFMAPYKKKQLQQMRNIEHETVLSDDEKAKRVAKGIEIAFESYKKNKIMPDACAWIYNILHSEGQMNHSEDEERHINTGARETLKNLLESKRKAINKNNTKEMTNRLNNLDNDPLLPGLLKKIALKNYWDKQIEIDNI